MKIYINLFLLLTILIFSNINTNAQIVSYSNEYLKIGVGAKQIGMAGSSVASTNNSESVYWNPAGLNYMSKKYDVSLMHSEYFAGIAKYDNVNFAYKHTDSVAFGISFLRFGVDDIQNTLELIDENGNIDYSRIKSFSVADYALLLSYSRKTKIKGLSYGINMKIIYRHQGEFANAYGFGLDLGVLYSKKKLKIAAMIRDISTTFNAWVFNKEILKSTFSITNNELPNNSLEITLPSVVLGIAYDFNIYKKISVNAEIDADITFDGRRNVLISKEPVSSNLSLGLEFNYNNLIFVRTGVTNFQRISDFDKSEKIIFQPNIGIGVKLFNFSIDYALSNLGKQSTVFYSNIFSIRYSFDI